MEVAWGFIIFSAARQQCLICILIWGQHVRLLSNPMSIQGYAVLFENLKTLAARLHSGSIAWLCIYRVNVYIQPKLKSY